MVVVVMVDEAVVVTVVVVVAMSWFGCRGHLVPFRRDVGGLYGWGDLVGCYRGWCYCCLFRK